MKKRFGSRLIVAVTLLAAFCLWYSIAANYDYGALAGTYAYRDNIETCTLHLRADRTFEQELIHSGETQRSKGTWYRYGESHVSFSPEFVRLNGEETNAEGEAHGEFDKLMGLFPELTLAPIPGGPRFHRRVFGWK